MLHMNPLWKGDSPVNDALSYPYPSQRTVVYGQRHMVATSHPMATNAAMSVFALGGNAIDAAVASAAALTVVEPTSNGIGSDAFALVFSQGKLHGLNSSGRAPAAATIQAMRNKGHTEMPTHGLLPVTVPGAPGAWAELIERFGNLPLADVLAPAVQLAEAGHAVSPTVSKYWRMAAKAYATRLSGPEFAHWFETFAPSGSGPLPGEIVRLPHHATTLAEIGRTKARSFYEGSLADKIDAFSRKHGGFLRLSDLSAFKPEWIEPISVNYRGYDVFEIPPNGQGIVALMALNILSGFDMQGRETGETYHRQIEALKLAFADGLQYVTDGDAMRVSVEDMLSPEYAAKRRALIGDSALLPSPGQLPSSGTVYLCTADNQGNMVSYIQSNYMGFGSGIVIPSTGISLQNRGHTFSLDENHVNALAPGKRTYHTIIPGFLMKDGQPVGPFGVMGGFMQPQGHQQVVTNLIDFHLNPQQALDAPRWQWISGNKVMVERGVPDHIVQELIGRGHEVSIATESGSFGRGQIILRTEHGTLVGGTEPRADGHIGAW